MPARDSVDDFFARLSPAQRPHLEALRALSREVAPDAREELKWNLPTYVHGEKTNLWMLQAFSRHASLRFPPEFFAGHRDAVTEAGHHTGKGFVKLPYDEELPAALLADLMRARVEDDEEHGR